MFFLMYVLLTSHSVFAEFNLDSKIECDIVGISQKIAFDLKNSNSNFKEQPTNDSTLKDSKVKESKLQISQIFDSPENLQKCRREIKKNSQQLNWKITCNKQPYLEVEIDQDEKKGKLTYLQSNENQTRMISKCVALNDDSIKTNL